MEIKQVIIKNFFCYIGPEIFDFEKGLNIVSAKNSGGKSHLFNAFHWTFFNSVYVDKDEDSTKKEWRSADNVLTIPDNIYSNSKENEILTTSVHITLSSEVQVDDEISDSIIEYHFEKEIKFKKNGNQIIPLSKPELMIWYNKDGETKYLESGEQKWFLDKLFPVSIRKFMWFQGETVDELYDFSRPSTLNYAIKEISYFPIYENLVSITKAAESSIEKKIQIELKKRSKLTSEQEALNFEFENCNKRIQNLKNNIIEAKIEIGDLKDSILNEEEKLKGYDKYSDLKINLNKLEYEIKTINDQIENLTNLGKESFIKKWMLKNCDSLISNSTKNLDLLSKEIKSYQKSENPVPITLPGPEYVQMMLDDHKCHICEREVQEGTPAYFALTARMNDFRANQVQKILSDNYTELNRFKRNLLNELQTIDEEFQLNDDNIQKLISKRKKLLKQKENYYSDFGVTNESEISIGSSTAEQIFNKIKSLDTSKNKLEVKLNNYETEIRNEQNRLTELSGKKILNLDHKDSIEIPEIQAKNYINLINISVQILKDSAYNQLITEITHESNLLYSKYLGGNTQGEIEINRGVRIVDKNTKKQLSNLNTAELTAQKLAVANSFLSLSEKKMNRSFPLLADAPTSQFDDDNTIFLTENLSESFKQIIIMSKDYSKLKEEERKIFIDKAKISKFYELKNDLIDPAGIDSRTNKKTFIKIIK
jgi:DNA sulfur modification protein DndD